MTLRAPIAFIASIALSTTTVSAQSDPPSAQTIANNHAAVDEIRGRSNDDEQFASRGFLGTRADPIIRSANGDVVWRLDNFNAVNGVAPDSVNPSLWRHARLLARNGLFKVTDHIWQVRGFDLANITFVKGQTGWIVIDTLSSAETARAAYDLVSEKLGKRPIVAIIVTHSHSDHYGGWQGWSTPPRSRRAAYRCSLRKASLTRP